MRIVFATGSTYSNALLSLAEHRLAELMCRDAYPVAWVVNPITPLHVVTRRSGLAQVGERARLWMTGGRTSGLVFEYCPMVLVPHKDYPLLRTHFTYMSQPKLNIPKVRAVFGKHGFLFPDFLWLSNPGLAWLVNELQPKVTLYRISDDYAASEGATEVLRRVNEECVRTADVVLSSSLVQLQKITKVRPDAIYLPNAVDVKNFIGPRLRPPEYEGISSPIIAYAGTIGYWFDLDLVSKVAQELPGYSLFLIGPICIPTAELAAFRNVHVLGPKQYGEIAGYLQWADVGIIPFRNLEFVQSISPIKAYEYLACGLPVVATKWRELELANLPVDIVSADDFCEAIVRAVETNSKARKLERINFANQNTWEQRYKAIMGVIQQKIGAGAEN